MSGIPGLDPVEGSFDGTVDQDVNLVEVGGTAVESTAAALGLVPTQVFDAAGDPVTYGPTTIAVNHVTIDTTAGGTVIVPQRTGRDSVAITMLGATDVYIGPSGVTTATGALLLGSRGSTIVIPGSAAVYGIVAAGSVSVSFLEAYA